MQPHILMLSIRQHMKNKYYFLLSILFLGFLLVGCITSSQRDQRVIELPAGDPNTTIATAQQICHDLIAGGFGDEIHRNFPTLTRDQVQGVFLTANEGTFSQSGHSVFILTGINYTGSLPEAKAVADYCESAVRKAVSAKFPAPAK